MNITLHSPDEITLFKKQALQWASSFDTACYYDSNNYQDRYSAFEVLIAAGVLDEVSPEKNTPALPLLEKFIRNKSAFIPGFLSYDLKNEIENLSSLNQDHLAFPDLYFFEPEHLVIIKGNNINIRSSDASAVFQQILALPVAPKPGLVHPVEIQARFSKKEYLAAVENIKAHIKRGDIYEANFCQEFYAENANINPFEVFRSLNTISPTPFANFFKYGSKYIISATPERFLSKRGNRLISQPIKGTLKRSADTTVDQQLKEELRNNKKEQAENVMIVDLVRNDLTKCSVPGSVKVEELFGIYSFRQVHQMISTVVSEANPALSNVEIIRTAFPMGSMTGAPKISAMKLIEQFEKTRRGVFSGAVGYFDANGDFDFNVIIRTLLYNAKNGYLSFQVGSAITFASGPEKEYEECMVKAEAILKVLSLS